MVPQEVELTAEKKLQRNLEIIQQLVRREGESVGGIWLKIGELGQWADYRLPVVGKWKEGKVAQSRQLGQNSLMSQPHNSQERSSSNFPCSLTRNITSHSMENVAFPSLLR